MKRHMNSDVYSRARRTSLLIVLAVAALIAACGNRISQEALVRIKVEKVKKRASFDLQCSETGITVSNLDHSTMGANGCGKQVTYILQKCSPGAGWTEQEVKEHLCIPVLNSNTKAN